jgi:hypothetical protein
LKVLIERWVYNVESILDHKQALENSSSDPTSEQPPSIGWWKPRAELELVVGDFVGNGRRLRHCGVTNTVLEHLKRASDFKFTSLALQR